MLSLCGFLIIDYGWTKVVQILDTDSDEDTMMKLMAVKETKN